MATYVNVIPEERKRGKRLGRHVRHDERSRAYAAAFTEPRTVRHRRWGRPFDQGSLGACTGFAAAAAIQMVPHWIKGRRITAQMAVQFYSEATKLDPWEGEYPPEDTGSSGLGVAQALKNRGLITSYTHTFSLQHFMGALVLSPAIVGTNWYDSFDRPDSRGFIRISPNAGNRGGHEWAVGGQVITTSMGESYLEGWQSWGLDYGLRGRFFLPMTDFERLLEEDGDATFFQV